MNSLVCPFCNTAFDLPGVPGRVVCPRCGEAIPARRLAGPTSAGAEQPSAEMAEANPVRRPPILFGAALLALVLAGLGVWYFTRSPETIPTTPGQPIPLPTRPPISLAALRHLPPDTQIVVAFQPSPLDQYARRAGKTPEAVLAELGVPAALFEGLAKAGIPLDRIDHLAVGASLSGSPKVSVALFLRKPVEDEGQFREVLKARQNADKPGRARVDLPGFPLPLEMHKLDGTTYLFSTDDKALDAMLKPQDGADFLKAGLRDSLGRLDPASFAWIATDDQNWAELPTLALFAGVAKRPDIPKRLKGVRAVAIGLPLRPDLGAVASVRFADANAAQAFDAKSRPKLAGLPMELAVEKEWVTVQMPESSFAAGVPAALSLFDP